MPIPEDVRDFLGDLLGKSVSVSKRSVAPFDLEDKVYVTGLYVNDKDKLIGACVSDIKLAANAGAALALIPDVVAKEAIAAGKLEDGLRENFYEVANIVSALLNGPSVPHLRLTELVDGVPDEVIELAATAAGHKHYDITIMDYDGGMMALVGI